MHELSLMADLIRKIETIAQGKSVTGVTIRLGALSHISADHFREHFQRARQGTQAEGAQLELIECTDETDPLAQDTLLESIQISEQ